MSEAPRDHPSGDQPPPDQPRDGDRPGFSWEGQDAPRAADGGELPPPPDATQVMGPPALPPGTTSPSGPGYQPQYQPPAQPTAQPTAAYPAPVYQQPGAYVAAPYPPGYGAPPAYGAPGYGTPGYGTPPGYAPPPMSPESEDVRGKAVLWTILNGVAIFLCGNLLAIVGVILAAIAIGRSRTDVVSARRLVKWSWIWFIIGFAAALLFWVLYFFVIVLSVGLGGL